MKRILTILAASGIHIISGAIGNNDLKFSRITVEDGMNSNNVHCIYQGRDGMMWFGTHDGLTRYDTYKFKTWRRDPDDSLSIGNNAVYAIAEDRKGDMWIGTERGLWRMDRKRETFHRLPAATGAANVHVHSIALDSFGRIWFSTLGNGVFCYDPKIGKAWNWRHEEHSESLNSDYAPGILCDKSGNIWCITAGEYLHKFDPSRNRFTRIRIADEQKNIYEKNAFSLFEDSSGNLWIGGWDSGVFRYDPSTGVFCNYLTRFGEPVIKGRIHSLNESASGNLLIGSDSGLTVFDSMSGEYETVSYDVNPEKGLSDCFVHDILCDREGGLWLATYFGGVNYSGPNSSGFRFRPCGREGEKGRIISKFCEGGDGRMWIGTDDGGLYCYMVEEDRMKKIRLDDSRPDLNIHALLTDGDVLWVGTYSNGLYRMEVKTGKTVHWKKMFGSDRESVYSLYKDTDGLLWIGTKNGIGTFDGKTFKMCNELGYNSDVIDICKDREGNLWFASISRGLLTCSGPGSPVEKQHLPVGGRYYQNDEITAMSLINDRLWIGTRGRGMIAYDLRNRSAGHVWQAGHEFSDLTVYQIIGYGDNLWITTNKGLMKYNMFSGHTNMYGKVDGLQTDIFNFNSGLASSDGFIYLGTNGGFNYFKPENILKNPNVPEVVFTDFCINEGIGYPEIYRRMPVEDSSITVLRGKTFAITFAALSYNSPQRNRYRYKMSGRDREWTECGYSSNKVSFSDLPAGKYVFTVYGSNNDGLWGAPSSLNIRIKAPWWASTPAMVMYILFFSAMVFVIVLILRNNHLQRKMRRREKARYENEKIRIETELDFFTSLAHEIRTPVMLISSPADEVLATPGLPNGVVENMRLLKRSSDKLINLADEILGFRKVSSDCISTSPVDIVRCSIGLVEEFMGVAQSHGIELVISDETRGNVILDTNKDAYGKIISNLMTNAIKFTKNRISVRMCMEGRFFKISVFDNGPGVSEKEKENIFKAFRHYDKPSNISTPGFGLGLSICSMLAHGLGARIEVESKENEYSLFTLYLPLDGSNANRIIPEGDAPESPAPGKDMRAEELKNTEKNAKAKVLIVDDDEDTREYLSRMLRGNFDTLTASSGMQAYSMLKEGVNADILICDVVMPDMDGLELCRRLGGDINFCHIPIILLSANTDKDIIRQGVKTGADAYVTKPVDIEHLNIQIDNLLSKKRKLWDSFSKRPFQSIPTLEVGDRDTRFLKHVSEIILMNISDPDFSVDLLAEKLHMSRSVLFRRLKEEVGSTPNNFIKTMRLRKAAELIVQGKHKINEICYMTGFNTPSYFARCFFEHFGVLPRDFSGTDSH